MKNAFINVSMFTNESPYLYSVNGASYRLSGEITRIVKHCQVSSQITRVQICQRHVRSWVIGQVDAISGLPQMYWIFPSRIALHSWAGNQSIQTQTSSNPGFNYTSIKYWSCNLVQNRKFLGKGGSCVVYCLQLRVLHVINPVWLICFTVMSFVSTSTM